MECERALREEHGSALKAKIRAAHRTDFDSKLGTYLQVNPSLETPVHNNDIFEIERIHVTRFHTGSHNLLIETGRFVPGLIREMRICTCSNGVQSLRHVFIERNIVKNMYHASSTVEEKKSGQTFISIR